MNPSPAARTWLLSLARAAITDPRGAIPAPPAEIAAEVGAMGASFVSLHAGKRLRGCIGEILATRPLRDSVAGNARSAAFHDPRFKPVEPAELPGLSLEISILTAPTPVDSPERIELGRHGIILSKAGRRALFLPQVAPEQGWTLEQTLTHLAQKAGLAPDAWREGARLEVFEAIVFGESHGA